MWDILLQLIGMPNKFEPFNEAAENVGKNFDAAKDNRFRFYLSDFCILILAWSLLLCLLIYEYRKWDFSIWRICGFGICMLLFSIAGFIIGLGDCNRNALLGFKRTRNVGLLTALGSVFGSGAAIVCFG